MICTKMFVVLISVLQYGESKYTKTKMLSLEPQEDIIEFVKEPPWILKMPLDHRTTTKLAGELCADVCIVPFASGGNGYFAGDYTGWPQGLGEYNAHCMIVTNNATVMRESGSTTESSVVTN